MTMKIGAWLLLLAMLGLPLVLSLWLLFPVIAGIALVLLFVSAVLKRGPSFARYMLNPALALFLLLFAVWLFNTPYTPAPASVARSRVAGVLGVTAAPPEAPGGDDVTELRRTLDREVGVTRFKIQKVAAAIDSVRSAESVFMGLSLRDRPDTANLGAAIEDVTASLASTTREGTSGTLLDRSVLNAVVSSLASEVEKIALKSGEDALTRAELVGRQDQLPGLLVRQGVATLPPKLVRLENAIQQTLGAKLDSATTFIARYDRSSDTIAYEQQTTLRFNGSQPRLLDLSNYFSGRPSAGHETVTLRVNDSPATPVPASAARPPLALDTAYVTITRTFNQAAASHPILQGRYFLSFRAVSIHWPTANFPTVVTEIRLPDDPDRTWPWTVDTASGSRFAGVEIPRYSFIFSTPAGKPSDQEASTLVTFEDAGLTPQSLATNATASVEILPRWLSFQQVQEKKDLLVVENTAVAGLIAFISALITALLAWSAEPRKTDAWAARSVV